MRIALVGMPGAEKSKLAKEIRNRLPSKPHIIDRYVEHLQDETKFVYGRSATFVGNLSIMIERFNLEERAHYDGFDTVTCGTAIETAVYEAMNNSKESGVELTPLESQREYHVMNTMGYIIADLFKYDHVFFLRSTKINDYGFTKSSEENITFLLDANLVQYVTLDTNEDRISRVIKIVTEAPPTKQ